MQAFYIRYRNTQGTLMRILNAASRRALDMPSVRADEAEGDHQVVLLLDVTPKQTGQLEREWYSIVDVLQVSTAHAGLPAAWTLPHPPASVAGNTEEGLAARA